MQHSHITSLLKQHSTLPIVVVLKNTNTLIHLSVLETLKTHESFPVQEKHYLALSPTSIIQDNHILTINASTLLNESQGCEHLCIAFKKGDNIVSLFSIEKADVSILHGKEVLQLFAGNSFPHQISRDMQRSFELNY